MKLCIFLFAFLFIVKCVFGQDNPAEFYDRLIKQYEGFAKNDEKAFLYINQMIEKAGREQNYMQLTSAYTDAVYYSENHKLEYADSAIWASHLSKNKYVIANSYTLKGSVYYFSYRQYQNALSEYLSAYEYAEKTDDLYLKNKIKYHIAIVKSYLAFPEAEELFHECAVYFRSGMENSTYGNDEFNHQKGYLNSLHQLAVLNLRSENFRKADSIIFVGLENTPSTREFNLERAYFYKCRGISLYHSKQYDEAEKYLNNALPEIIKAKDFNWEAAVHYYLGKTQHEQNRENEAVASMKVVDSLFSRNKFFLPEVADAYVFLINAYHKDSDRKNELYYTAKLLKTDSLYAADFREISMNIHKNYDTRELMIHKKELKKINQKYKWGILGSGMAAILLFIGLLYNLKKQKRLNKRYRELADELQFDNNSNLTISHKEKVKIKSHSVPDDDLTAEILEKLNKFENQNGFTERKLTLQKLAFKLKTNTAYLSQVINTYKGKSFNRYLNGLRIDFITRQLYNNEEFTKYSTEYLAKYTGFGSRQQFSKVFYEINGIRPSQFQERRKQEFKKQAFLLSG